jgi:phosphate transport system permease protein
MSSAQPPVREQVKAASARLRGLKRIDRAAAILITAGGLGIVASVIGILVFVAGEAVPLFYAGKAGEAGRYRLQAAPAPVPSPPVASAPGGQPSRALVTGVDEYQRYLWQVRSDGRFVMYRAETGALVREAPLSGLPAATTLTSAARTLSGDAVAVATADGQAVVFGLSQRPVYQDQKLSDVEIELAPASPVKLDPQGRPITQVTLSNADHGVLAGLVGPAEIAVWMPGESSPVLEGTEAAPPGRAVLVRAEGERLTSVRLGPADRLIAGTAAGRVLHWQLSGEEPRLTAICPVGSTPVTALTWILGDVTFIAGTQAGELTAWFAVRLQEDEEPTLVRTHTYVPQGSPVVAMTATPRDKAFAVAGADGSVTLHYMTNERRLARVEGGAGGSIGELVLTPRNDALYAFGPDGEVVRYGLQIPHPEITARSLFGKSWYEGYGKPEYVWQSTGGTNDFETKFSLVPLILGTLKGTFYALIFAIPLAVLGALYTSQFVHPSIRARIKPTLEVMAALPSVVIGFVAGLWLAPIVELWVVPVLLMIVLLPAIGTAGVLLWKPLPRRLTQRLKPGMELFLIVPLLALGVVLAIQLGPSLELAFFKGDFKLWLSTALGVTYDQRNSLVVGLAMGFAVIPIIFTIADDAFASVPSSLTAGSLALGASRWQTALRVVVPTASPGVFSAVMIGFGRAVGETMIVLMATGNTPVLDWSIFNGMRTLSANIAVEIPEAPHGDTLYRVLFLSAALLFAMTFVVNTVAEIIRQRLRERYRAL